MDGGEGSWLGALAIGSPDTGNNLTLLRLRALCFPHPDCLFSAVCSPQQGSEEIVSILHPTSGFSPEPLSTVLRRDSGAEQLITQYVAVILVCSLQQRPKANKVHTEIGLTPPCTESPSLTFPSFDSVLLI